MEEESHKKKVAFLREAQIFVNSLIDGFNAKFPKPVADIDKATEMVQYNFDIWEEKIKIFQAEKGYTEEYQPDFQRELKRFFDMSNERAKQSCDMYMDYVQKNRDKIGY
jgi:hypothetical protein